MAQFGDILESIGRISRSAAYGIEHEGHTAEDDNKSGIAKTKTLKVPRSLTHSPFVLSLLDNVHMVGN